MSTLKRRALSTCGTRYTSANVGALPRLKPALRCESAASYVS